MGNRMGIGVINEEDNIFDIHGDEFGDNIFNFPENVQFRRPDIDLMMPICEKPNVEKFRHTEMYKEIKARSSLPCKPIDSRWNLMTALQKRENGMAAPGTGSFSPNQQRYFSNLYIPNHRSMRLMSLDAKIFVSKFNKSGSKLLTACQDGCVRINDGSKGTYHLLNRINARDVQWCITDVDFSPNGKHFAYSTLSRSFYIMPLDGSDEHCQWIDVSETSGSRVGIFSLRYSATGDKLVGGSNNSTVFVGDVETRATDILRTHRMPVPDVNAICFVKDNDPNVIIAGCDDGLLKVYDLRTTLRSRSVSRSVLSFMGHFDGITFIDSRNDGYHVLSNSKDQSIKVWDMRQPSNLRSRSTSLQHQLAMTNWDYRYDRVPHEFYNPHKALDGDTSIMTYRGHRVSKTLLRAKFSPMEQTGQRFIYTACATGRIIIYDVLTGKIREAIEGHKGLIRDLDWHPVRSEIVSSSWDKHVNLNSYNRNTANTHSLRRRYSFSFDYHPLRRSRRLASNYPPE